MSSAASCGRHDVWRCSYCEQNHADSYFNDVFDLDREIAYLKQQLAERCRGNLSLMRQLLESQARVAELEAVQRKYGAAVRAFTSLMHESEGVYGLHLNGDVAPWGDLEKGGRFEDWLLPLSDLPEAPNE